jgi:formate hydrogenlyase subunit 6/NADH:ubiquinone oxidoreductase subunit I
VSTPAAAPAFARRLSRDALDAWLAALIGSGRRVLAPVQQGSLRTFQPVTRPSDACLAPGKTRWSPKEHLFPRTERIFSYRSSGAEVALTPAPREATPQVLFAVRPCDAAGFRRLDAVFGSGPGDALYDDKRRRSTIVTLACAVAEPECFCAAVGGHPAGTEGADAELLPAGDGWLARALTSRGEALLAQLAEAPAATAAEWNDARTSIDALAEQMAGSPMAREWAAALERAFDLPLWEAVGQRCLGCSICNYLCPSCSCFDVQDSGTAWCGDRCRSWDSCTFALFTKHGSGHNPRATQAARYRQRVLHKFSYYPQAHDGAWMCVGCGRCAKACPVGLSIRESVELIAAAAGSAAAGAAAATAGATT